MIILEKKLSASERERHIIKIPALCTPDLPDPGEPFDIIVNSKNVRVVVGKGDRLVGLGFEVFNELGLDKPGAIAVLETNKNADYVLKSKKGT